MSLDGAFFREAYVDRYDLPNIGRPAKNMTLQNFKSIEAIILKDWYVQVVMPFMTKAITLMLTMSNFFMIVHAPILLLLFMRKLPIL